MSKIHWMQLGVGLALGFGLGQGAWATVQLPSVFGEHMVLQQGQKNPVWGWGRPGEKVTVSLAGQAQTATVGENGRWRVQLDPMPVGGPHQLTVQGENQVRFEDVWVGEVWLCSGQSNMQFPVKSARDAELEIRTARYPKIRFLTVPQVGTQEVQEDFAGQWQVCSPETVPDFSAVGYFFGRLLYQGLDVPVGLIDNSWGGSSAEAWVRRDLLAGEDRYRALLERWEKTEQTEGQKEEYQQYEQKVKEWQAAAEKARAEAKPVPARPKGPRSPMVDQHRPGNLYNGVLKPVLGYGIRGAIWYQGESNAGRAYQYRHLFPLMIESWRKEWGQGDFPFYWVQLADFKEEVAEPGESDWAELREAQTMTLSRLPNTGEAVIIDLGEADDIHPRNKQDVATRLARWALKKDYGVDLVYRSPIYQGLAKQGNKIVITFDQVGGGLSTFDIKEPLGFAIAGSDRRFVKAQAKISGRATVEVWSEAVAEPEAVRYAWANNPVCNLRNREGLPVTPFRTDDWPGITAEKN